MNGKYETDTIGLYNFRPKWRITVSKNQSNKSSRNTQPVAKQSLFFRFYELA